MTKAQEEDTPLETPIFTVADIHTKAAAASSMQNTVSTLISFTLFKKFPEEILSPSFIRVFESLHTFYGFEVHGYHDFGMK